MNTLAMDTCFGACSVAVRWRSQRGEWQLRESYEERDSGHAERLLVIVQDVMEASGLAFAALDRIAVTHGPGTFTGMRIGIAAARGLALAAGLPVVVLSSLAVMAHRADQLLAGRLAGNRRPGTQMVVAVDARRGELYCQSFGGSVAEPLGEPELLPVETAAARLGSLPTLAVGSGAAALAEAGRRIGAPVEALLMGLQPHARYLALLAEALPPVAEPVPLYLRPADARPQAMAAPPAAP